MLLAYVYTIVQAMTVALLLIGTISQRKSGKTGAWRLMAIGASLATFGFLWGIAASYEILNSLRDIGMIPIGRSRISAIYALSRMGELMFATGFLFFCLRKSSSVHRIEELELMNLAQATELERLRNR